MKSAQLGTATPHFVSGSSNGRSTAQISRKAKKSSQALDREKAKNAECKATKDICGVSCSVGDIINCLAALLAATFLVVFLECFDE